MTDQNPMLQPDIFHLVFLQLPQVDLLLCQQVCKTWKAAIEHSNTLQAALFFRPGSSRTHSGTVEVNGLLLRHFRGFFLAAHDDSSHIGPFSKTLWHSEAAKSHPDAKKLCAYARREASWRRMLLCWPTAKQLQVFVEGSGMLGTFGEYRKLSFDTVYQATCTRPFPQLTFGLIYDMVQDYMFASGFYQDGITATMAIIGVSDNAYQIDDDGDCVSQQQAMTAMLEERRNTHTDDFPDFASSGSVLLRLHNVSQCCVDDLEPDPYQSDYLKSEGSISLEGIQWETRVKYKYLYD